MENFLDNEAEECDEGNEPNSAIYSDKETKDDETETMVKMEYFSDNETEESDEDSDQNTNADEELPTKKLRLGDDFVAQHMKLKCEICEEEFVNFHKLKVHFSKIHQTKGYVTCCKKRLISRSLLIDHLNLHLDPNYFA